MSIFSRRNLSVTKQDVKTEYRKMSDEELIKQVRTKFINSTRIYGDLMMHFLYLYDEVPFTRKQCLLFLEKFNTSGQMIGYYYRHLVRCAHFYGVPKVIIKNYQEKKEMYNLYKDDRGYRGASKKDAYQRQLHKEGTTLLSATLEMVSRSNSRKGKLQKITDKIIDKEN